MKKPPITCCFLSLSSWMYLGVKKLTFLWLLLVRRRWCMEVIWFIGKFWFLAPNLLYSYGWKILCAPIDLSEIWGVVMSTCIPVAWKLLGDAPEVWKRENEDLLLLSLGKELSSFSSGLRAEMLSPAWGLCSCSPLLCRYWQNELNSVSGSCCFHLTSRTFSSPAPRSVFPEHRVLP